MRNDAHDELDDVPSLTAGRDRVAPYPPPELEAAHKPVGAPRQKRRAPSTGPLWTIVLLLAALLAGLGWWSFQRISQLEAQMVATQESFARISEDANGRLQEVSGKIVATESSVTSASEAVRLRIKQLEGQTAELLAQQRAITTQQQSLTGKQSGQEQRLDAQNTQLEGLATDLKGQQAAAKTLQDSLATLSAGQTALQASLTAEQAALKASVAALGDSLQSVGAVAARVDGLGKDVAALKRQGDSSQAIARLEQDLLVLRSQVDNLPPPQRANTNTAEFDSFRAQVTRTINSLQGQIANLQGQIDAR